ncbi:MAG: hypothetical protein NTW17_00400 [Candidatus Pacearchaeota archaeon]|nr:hypothetical protein [Candidatus Pacearchaeota archaeon]
MEYTIYHLTYHLGANPDEEAVVSASSSERAKSLLEESLDKRLFHEEGRAKQVGFQVDTIENMPAATDTEMVFCPYMPEALQEA